MGILLWIAIGLFAGVLAKMLMPGADPGGIIATTLIGIGGAIVGGMIGTVLGFGSVTGFDFRSLVIATGGAVALLYSYRVLRPECGSLREISRTTDTFFFHTEYHKPRMVTDPVLGIQIPKSMATAIQDADGQTIDFFTNESCRQFTEDPSYFTTSVPVSVQSLNRAAWYRFHPGVNHDVRKPSPRQNAAKERGA